MIFTFVPENVWFDTMERKQSVRGRGERGSLKSSKRELRMAFKSQSVIKESNKKKFTFAVISC